MSYNLTGAAQGGNLVLSRAGGATANISAVGTTVYTIQNVTYSIAGKLFFKATASGATLPNTDVTTGVAHKVQAANTVAAYALCLNAAGTVSIVQGQIVPWTDTSANSTAVPVPSVPDTLAVVSVIVVKNGATGSAFTFGTTSLGATGIVVDTPFDVFAPFSGTVLTA
jgi:hypothetical protein